MERDLVPHGTIIGVYGKIGPSKGTPWLFPALASLAERGLDFTFMPVPCGRPETLEGFASDILRSPKLAERTLLLPPMLPQLIPTYIRNCHVVCFLEHSFDVTFHAPRVPREVLAAGRCLMVTKEIVEKQSFGDNLIHEKNALIVDPKATKDELASTLERLIQTPTEAEAIGARGQVLSEWSEAQRPERPFSQALQEWLR
jgi:glycosyltransferase involved in cell wall biosynthesis